MTTLKLIKVAPPLAPDDFTDIESKFNIRLPSSLKEHYLKYNGGYTNGYKMCYVPKDISPAEADSVTCNGFYPIKYRNSPNESTLEEVYFDYAVRQELFNPKEYMPFAFDVSDYPLLINLDNHKIYLLNRDYIDDDGNETIDFIANSLQEFIDGLMDSDEYENSL